MMIVEILAVAFNVGYIVLATRGNVWGWPLGILGSALSIWLFIEGKIYAEAFLFVYYVVVGFYGWWQWKKKRTANDELKVEELKLRHHFLIFAAGYFLVGVMYWFLDSYTDAQMPLLDSFTTVFSFIATWLSARRYIENWIYWIAINGFTVYLYHSRGFDIYAVLSVVYIFMAVYGLYNWQKISKSATPL